MAYIYKQVKFKFFELLPILLLFFISLSGNSVIDLRFFSVNVHYILVYFWVLRQPRNLGYGFIFLSGIISDVVLGLPFGVNALSLLLIAAVAFYFVEMLSREVVLNITQSPYFWVCFGILIYCVTYLPFYITLLFFIQENPIILSVVLFLINCIQYCCIAIAFIKANRRTIEHPLETN